MKRVEHLINQIRRQSDNSNYSDTEGVEQEEFVFFLNDAQSRLQNKILSMIPETALFDTTQIISLVGGTRSYSLVSGNDRPWLDHSVRFVEYSYNGQEDTYYPLIKRSLQELITTDVEYPEGYDIRNQALLLSPIPTSSLGQVRVTFPKTLDALDLRRAQIDTVNTSGSDYSEIVLDSTTVDAVLSDADNLPYYICINDPYGAVTYYNALVTAYDNATSTLTLSGAATSAGTISPDSYVTFGERTTTHSKLPDACEKYLIAYTSWKLLKRDSSVDAQEQNAELAMMEAEIVDALRSVSRDVSYPVLLNSFYTL